jgi:hypothetical protein
MNGTVRRLLVKGADGEIELIRMLIIFYKLTNQLINN